MAERLLQLSREQEAAFLDMTLEERKRFLASRLVWTAIQHGGSEKAPLRMAPDVICFVRFAFYGISDVDTKAQTFIVDGLNIIR